MNKYSVTLFLEKQSVKCIVNADNLYAAYFKVIEYCRNRVKSLKGFKMYIAQIGGG